MQLPWSLASNEIEHVESLMSVLDLSPTAASILVRRGYSDPEHARDFLEPQKGSYDVMDLGDINEALTILRNAVERGQRICVHGDYDVDGICATAVTYSVLSELGANTCWFLPSRFIEGYGLQRETVDHLLKDGVEVLITVDCGISAVDEISYAQEQGLTVIVTDHHRPGSQVPECPIVATKILDYVSSGLCGTGVAYRLMQALAPELDLSEMLDLVALATVADVVPLVDENRALAWSGIKRLSCTTRPGLQALMRVAQVDPATVNTGEIGFRIAPRLNAAGRLGSPDVALRLLLSETREEARRNVEYGLEDFATYFKDISTFPIVPHEIDNAYEYLMENRVAVIGTPDDAIEYIETLLEGSGGFGSLMQLAHNWADWEATKRNYELIARYVMPHFQKSNLDRTHSYNYSRDNKDKFQGQAAQAVQTEIERYEEKKKGLAAE